MSRQEPLLQTPAQQFADKEKVLLVLETGGDRELQSYFDPERAFVKPGPRAWAYRIPSFSLPGPPKPEGKSFGTALTIFIGCLRSEHLRMLPQHFWIKLQTLQTMLGMSFPLPAPQFSGEKRMAFRETEATWQRAEGTSCPQHPILARSVWTQ